MNLITILMVLCGSMCSRENILKTMTELLVIRNFCVEKTNLPAKNFQEGFLKKDCSWEL